MLGKPNSPIGFPENISTGCDRILMCRFLFIFLFDFKVPRDAVQIEYKLYGYAHIRRQL